MDVFVIPGLEYDSNIYVLVGKIPTIIDTGTGFHSAMVITALQQLIKPMQIQQIVLTHEHYDHVGGVLDIVSASKGTAKIFAHRNVIVKLREGRSTFAEMLGGTMPKINVDVSLSGGEQLTLGNQTFEVLFTPGHSSGCLCLYSKNNQYLFSGDTIFANGGFGRYDFPGGDFKQLLQSIERLAALEVKNLYPGHGPIVEKYGTEHVKTALQSISSLV